LPGELTPQLDDGKQSGFVDATLLDLLDPALIEAFVISLDGGRCLPLFVDPLLAVLPTFQVASGVPITSRFWGALC
jgi:hypothetical protein